MLGHFILPSVGFLLAVPFFWRLFCTIDAGYLTIIPRARMGSASIAHEAEGRTGY